MIRSKNSKNDRNDVNLRPHSDNVVAIPFPIEPRRILYGQSAKMLDLVKWKQRSVIRVNKETDHGGKDKSIEELEKLSQAEQQIWVIRKLLEMYDSGDSESLQKLYEILCNKSPDSA